MFTTCRALGIGSAMLLAASLSSAQATTADIGRVDYEAHCASCHGVGGKGDGAMRPFLTKAPSDLTTLSRRHGGAFPTQLVWETIDGRNSKLTGLHGTREMPVWGATFRSQSMRYPEMASQAEWYVRGRIVSLIDHLARIQVQ